MGSVAVTCEAEQELRESHGSVRAALSAAAARLVQDPSAGRSILEDRTFPFRRLDVTDGYSIVYRVDLDTGEVLITQFAQPHLVTPQVCLDEASQIAEELADDDPTAQIIGELAKVAESMRPSSVA